MSLTIQVPFLVKYSRSNTTLKFKIENKRSLMINNVINDTWKDDDYLLFVLECDYLD